MIRLKSTILSGVVLSIAALTAAAQSPSSVQRLAFDRPEAWALKYFTSSTMLSGLQSPIAPPEGHRFGSIGVGMELGWIPELSPERRSVGFTGRKQEDLNKTPILARPVIRVGLPWQFTALAAAPVPIRAFGVRPRLLALGLERPIVQRDQWRIGWRMSGQLGSVKGGFTCPKRILAFAPGTPENPSNCVGESADIAFLRYIGTEIQFAHRIPQMQKLTPHAAIGVNWIEGAFQVNAPLATRTDRSRLWTHGTTYTGSAGASYSLTNRMAFVVDAFYTPLSIRRTAASSRVNDGLFNVRAMLSYDLR